MFVKFAFAAATAAFLAIVAGPSANAQSANGQSPYGVGSKVPLSHTSATMSSQRVPAQVANIPPAKVPTMSMTTPPAMTPTGLPARLVPAVSPPPSAPAIQLIKR
jgi:hypothetical protein